MYYRIPVAERIIDEKKGTATLFVVIDDIGYKVVNHKKGPSRANIEDLKKMPSTIIVSNLYIEADSPEKAVRSFFGNSFGASCGPVLPACVIDKKLPIIEINCPRIGTNVFGEVICGKEVSGIPIKSGLLGFCVLEHNAFPQNCDVEKRIAEIDKNKDCSKTCIKVGDAEYNVTEIKIK